MFAFKLLYHSFKLLNYLRLCRNPRIAHAKQHLQQRKKELALPADDIRLMALKHLREELLAVREMPGM